MGESVSEDAEHVAGVVGRMGLVDLLHPLKVDWGLQRWVEMAKEVEGRSNFCGSDLSCCWS